MSGPKFKFLPLDEKCPRKHKTVNPRLLSSLLCQAVPLCVLFTERQELTREWVQQWQSCWVPYLCGMFVLVPFSVRIPEGLRAERRRELSLYGGLTGVVVRLWETANGYYQYLTNRNHTTVPSVLEVSPGTVCTSQFVTQDTPWILLPKCPWLERCGSIILWSFLVSSHFLRFNSQPLFFLWWDCLGIRVSCLWSHQLRIKTMEKQLSSVWNADGLSAHRRQYSITIY